MWDQVFTASLIASAGFAGLALGAAGQCAVHAAPLAFKRLDYSRADALVRRMLKGALPWIALASLGGAAFALLGGAYAAGGMLGLAGAGLVVARYALAPLEKRSRIPGSRKRYAKTRNISLYITSAILLLFPAALIALALGI